MNDITKFNCGRIRTHGHLICKPTLNNIAKVAKCLNCAVRTYLYSVIDCVYLPCHIHVLSESSL